MIFKICRRCQKVIIHPATYCDSCLERTLSVQNDLKAKRNSKYNKSRDTKYKQFYNSNPWKILKAKKLEDEQYKCERCKKIASEVHHIEAIQTELGWLRRLDYDNLEALCLMCHNFRHKRFQKRRRSL